MHKGQVWFRRGSSNDVALSKDLQELFSQAPIIFEAFYDPELKRITDEIEKEQTLMKPTVLQKDSYLRRGYKPLLLPNSRRKIHVGRTPKDPQNMNILLMIKRTAINEREYDFFYGTNNLAGL